MDSLFKCVKLLLLSKLLHTWFLLLDCFVCHQYVTCLKRFSRYRHYTGEAGDLVIARLAIVS